ncbi:neuroblastoma breakpoint family member 3-like isoform X1 [Cebus imitator]|uniref:neuroblastoma breakpoint family member 3-like isoform X1 n=1 Tax=Cebus imitator TaxID=2715852 RepID=UPI00189716AC|nr:neuroblastoma breakpoint family member 3-like isoform X1 [Cebus imitator]
MSDCACGAPNVSMVASGRTCSRKTTAVNFPDIIENSYSQQEETKPNFRDSKYRLLMSQVAYFRNYQLKTYEDRKDHDEEQKCRDSKNKLLMSQVAYYLGCRLKTEDDQKDHDEEQKYRESKNKHLTSQVAYYLGCRLKTEQNDQEEDEDVHVTESEQIQESRAPRLIGEVPKVDVKRVLEDSPEECVITRSNIYGPSDSSQPPYGDTNEIPFEEDNLNSALVVESPSSRDAVEDALIILSEDRKDHEEDRQYGDSQNKLLMSQAAYDLGCRLKTEENEKDEDEDVHVVEAEEIQESCAPREVQKIEVKKVPEDSLEECVVTRSNSYGPPDSSQPPRDTNEITFEEDSVDSALVVESESSHDVVEDALIILSEIQSDDEEEEEKGPVPPRNLQESVEEEAPQESWDEGYLTLSVPPGTSAFNEPYRSSLHLLEDQQVDLARDIDKIKNDQEEEEGQGPPCPRLSMELVEAEEPEVFRYSLDILYSMYTAYPEFYYTCQDYTYAIFLLVEEHVRLTLDMDSRFLTMTVIRLHLVSRIGVIFPH